MARSAATDDALPATDDALLDGYARRARARTCARILWSAQAEGLGSMARPARTTNAVTDVLHAVQSSIRASCGARQLEFDEATWQVFERELENSIANETAALAWRETQWRPALRQQVGQTHDSLWSWLGTLDCLSEEAQLAWEICASFDGHLTHPCAKTKLHLDRADLERWSAEFSPKVPLLLGALATSAAAEHCIPSCGATSVTAYFQSRFPDAYDAFVAWFLSHAAADERILDHWDIPSDDVFGLTKRCTEHYIPLPIHPANLDHVRRDFAGLIEQGLLVLPDSSAADTAPTLVGAPLMSFRTLLPATAASATAAPPYIKLPVPVQITSLRRYLSPVETNGGPIISHVLQRILQTDAALASRLAVLAEECSVSVCDPDGHVTYEQARYLSCMYRANVASVREQLAAAGARRLAPGTRIMPLASLLCEDPLSSQPVLRHVLHASGATEPPAASEWYASYATAMCDVALRLFCCYGVTLEMHGQNTLLALSPSGRLETLICREIAGGAYCCEPLLVARGFDIRARLHPRQDAVFEKEALPLSILLHAIFCQHLLPLADAVASLFDGLAVSSLISLVREAIERTLGQIIQECEGGGEKDGAHVDEPTRGLVRSLVELTDKALLRTPTTRAKSLLHMRALGTKSELFSEARNPILAGGAAEEADEATQLGRLAAFPLQWREPRDVEGATAWEWDE